MAGGFSDRAGSVWSDRACWFPNSKRRVHSPFRSAGALSPCERCLQQGEVDVRSCPRTAPKAFWTDESGDHVHRARAHAARGVRASGRDGRRLEAGAFPTYQLSLGAVRHAQTCRAVIAASVGPFGLIVLMLSHSCSFGAESNARANVARITAVVRSNRGAHQLTERH